MLVSVNKTYKIPENILYILEAYLESSEASTMELFAKVYR